MGFDIGGSTIVKNGFSFVSLNSLEFNASGHGSANPIPGFLGWKAGGSTYYSAPSGWEINSAGWYSSLNPANGVFTCPVAGLYALGYNGIHRGGSNTPAGYNCYGYAGFAKNGALSYFVHWNQQAGTYWNTGGTSALFQCAAGDTLALFINRPPAPAPPNDVYTVNYGMYPDGHHTVWCKLIG